MTSHNATRHRKHKYLNPLPCNTHDVELKVVNKNRNLVRSYKCKIMRLVLDLVTGDSQSIMSKKEMSIYPRYLTLQKS